MEVKVKTLRLPSGLRVATASMPGMASVGIGIWAEVGSRHEAPAEHGMAHLVEHLLFKGTPSRSAMDISRQIERLGGGIDAFTVEDHTCYHARCPAEGFSELLDVMSDMYQNPVFDHREIENEKRVIREEISMVQDQPAQLLEDLISEATWGKQHPLGRPITGTLRSLSRFTRDQVFDFFRRSYGARQTVVSVAGNIDEDEVIERVSQAFGSLSPGNPVKPRLAPGKRPGMSFYEMDDREQAHLAIAFRAAHRYDPDRFSQKILNVILGENMSSRLFQRLREQLGLCYEVQSDTVAFSDAGVMQIYLALDPENLKEALEALSGTLQDLCKAPPPREEVAEAISYCIGQSRINLEAVTSQMMWAGECLLSFDKWIDPEEIHRELSEVTAGMVQSSACGVFRREGLAVALAGPAESIEVASQWAREGNFNY